MLHVLDPHSNFYDPKAYAQMREDQHGKYYGVGMSIQPQGNKIVVLAPFEGTPSYKAGIRPGRRDPVRRRQIDRKHGLRRRRCHAQRATRNPCQSPWAAKASAKPLTFDLVRDEIPRYSVDLAFMIKPGIGYIHVTNFMETTSREVQERWTSSGPTFMVC